MTAAQQAVPWAESVARAVPQAAERVASEGARGTARAATGAVLPQRSWYA